MPPQDALSTQDVPIPPKGYQLLAANTPAPRKLTDLMAEASQRNPVSVPKGYVLDRDLTLLNAIRKKNASRTSISAAPEPSTLEQIRQSVANTAIGHSLESMGLAKPLGLTPTETVNSPDYQAHKEQLLAPEYAAPVVADNLGLGQTGGERLEGALKGVGGLTSASNMALMAGTAVAAGLTAGVINPASAQLLSRAVSGGFTLDMLYGLYQQNKEYKQAVDSGNLSEAHRIQGEMGVTGIMAMLTGKHALTKHPFTPIDTQNTPARERTNVLHRNGAGEVRQASGQAPTVWLSPEAWQHFMGALYPGEDPAATHGLTLPANEHLHSFATDPQLAAASPKLGNVQQLLAEAHKNADNGGVAIANQRPSLQANVNVMREEVNHTWQRSLAENGNVHQHLNAAAFSDLYQSIPGGMYDHLLDNGYNGYYSPEMVTEAAAKLMDGRPERFGVDKDDAVDFLDKYFKQVTDQHGAKALEELQHVRGIAADAKARAIEEHGRTGAGQDNRTVPSVGNGGQGGDAQGVPAEGEGVAAFNRDKDDPDSQMALFRQMGEKLKEARNNYSANKPETVAAYKEALRNYEFSSPSFMKRYMREQMGQMQNSGDVADVQELERMSKLGETLFNREKDKPVWYLKSERLIGEKMKGPMPAEDAHKMLLAGGVKPEEMHWTGLDDFLKSKGKEKVTPEEIREHLADNNIQIKEVTKGDGLTLAEKQRHDELLSKVFQGMSQDESNELNRLSAKESAYSPTKFGSYVLPGGKNYREMLLTMPHNDGGNMEVRSIANELNRIGEPQNDPDRWNELAKQYDVALSKLPGSGLPVYQSGHWDEPNILAHVRFNDRTGPNGEKLLHVEEVQSDWHQKGRDKGYQGDIKGFAVSESTSYPGKYEIRNPDGRLVAGNFESKESAEKAVPFVAKSRNNGVPDAPLKKTWHEMAMRRALKYAAENGYDGVSWTGGEDQNKRYSLSSQVHKIVVPMVDKDGSRSVRIDPIGDQNSFKMMVAPDGTVDGSYSASQFSGKKLDEVIGKEMAQRVMDIPHTDIENLKNGDRVTLDHNGKQVEVTVNPERRLEEGKPKESIMVTSTDGKENRWFVPLYEFNSRSFSGEGLEVGGSGMKGFYDKIVPDYLNKFGKKYGAKVGETTIPVDKHGDTAHRRFSLRNPNGEISSQFPTRQEADKVAKTRQENGHGNWPVGSTWKVEDSYPENDKTVQYLPVTPEMRKSVQEEGVPLFNRETHSATGQESVSKPNTDEKEGTDQSPNPVEGGGQIVPPLTVIPVQASAPKQKPAEKVHTSVPHHTTTQVSVPLQTAMDVTPVVTTRVLPLTQVKAMAAGLYPQRQPKNVREVMIEAKARMGNSIVP